MNSFFSDKVKFLVNIRNKKLPCFSIFSPSAITATEWIFKRGCLEDREGSLVEKGRSWGGAQVTICTPLRKTCNECGMQWNGMAGDELDGPVDKAGGSWGAQWRTTGGHCTIKSTWQFSTNTHTHTKRECLEGV